MNKTESELLNLLLVAIKDRANGKAKSDDADFEAYGYSSGNYDDAYYMGVSDGEISFARDLRKIIAAFGEESNAR